MQFNKAIDEYKASFMKMTEQHELMRGVHLDRTTEAKHHIILNPPDVLSIHFVPYNAGPKQMELQRCKVGKASVAKSTAPKWTMLNVFVPKKDV